MKSPNRGGRPRREPKPGERVPLSFRATPELKAKLDRAASDNGRSQAQEAELRLQDSFRQQALLPQVLELAYGPKVAGILMAIGLAMKESGRSSAFDKNRTLEAADNWPDDAHGYDQAIKAAATILQSARPEGAVEPPVISTPRFGDIGGLTGQMFASGIIDAIKGGAVTAREEREAAPIAALLGNITDRMAKPNGRVSIVVEED